MRFTIKNPDGSFRLPMLHAGEIRMQCQQGISVFFGDAINRLGEYEQLGDLEELKKKLKK